MKYRIVLAEDEPAAAENIYDIIRLYCPDFELSGSAENGEEALELARALRPDLLLTDIKMPVINGLELIKRLNEEMPDIKTIVISGYQDFEYARKAMRHGAVDYLLKPISPSTLQATLKGVVPVIENDRAQKRLNFIGELLAGRPSVEAGKDKLFPAPLYIAGLCRKNGLAGRFSGIKMIFPQASRAKGDSVDFYGKDDMECIHIEPGDTPPGADKWEKLPWLNRDIPGYRTIVFHDKPFPITELPKVIEELCSALARFLVIGKTQVLPSSLSGRRAAPLQLPAPDNDIAYYLKDNRSGKIKELLRERLELWEKSAFPQFLAEEDARYFLEQIRNFYPEASNTFPEDRTEFLVDEAFYYATNYPDLEKNLFYIIDRLLPGREAGINKIDTPEFFGLIEEYVRNKLAEPLSLQQSCVHFGISQTYMSKLFRKYTGLSFTNYLTRSRVEKAKTHLAGGGVLIKDVAALTGFNDQFYFSKVFKAFTGRSPSEFASDTN